MIQIQDKGKPDDVKESLWNEIVEEIEEFNNDSKKWAEKEANPSSPEEGFPFRNITAVYQAADALSIENAKKHQQIIGILSLCATLLTMAFLLYDEMYLYGLIVVCGILLIALFAINKIADRLHCHKKYLEYRLFAEGLRVQYFLLKAGIQRNIATLLPWSWQFNVPWTKTAFDIMNDEMKSEMETGENSPFTKSPILDIWIRDQRNYHVKALAKNEIRTKTNDRIMTISLLCAVLAYIGALAFEIAAGGLFSGNPMMASEKLEFVRTILKILLGTLSAITLFAGNYYGKLSLEDAAQDHRRMIALYEKAEKEILEHGETEEELLYLAREELEENSSWYAYQNKNKPDISI